MSYADEFPDTTWHTAADPQGRCQFDDNLRCKICGAGFPGYHEHTKDEDCVLSPGGDGTCDVCGVYHGHPCDCGGRGFHKPGCAEMADNDGRLEIHTDHQCGDECRSNGCTERFK